MSAPIDALTDAPIDAPTEAEEFVAAARQSLRGGDGAAALDALGWWGLLDHLDDRSLRTAAFALFRAQGRELASSPALGALLAQPYAASTGAAPGTVVAAALRHSPRKGLVAVVVGDVAGRAVLVDRPGEGVSLVDGDDLRRIDVPGDLPLFEVDPGMAGSRVAIGDGDAAVARRRSTFLGRVAAAAEILGAAEGAVDLAITYAGDRVQFGEPIGRFQAVRHLLAWARTDCVALQAVVGQAVRLDEAAAPHYDEVVKALAGRNGRRACERALQVLGGIGFTAEHDHHRHHGRVLLLDGVLGTSAALTHGLGTWLRELEDDPGFTAAALGTGRADD